MHIDFETRSYCDLKKHGAWRYSEHESTDIICMAYKIDNNPIKLWTPDFNMPLPFKIVNPHKNINIIARYALFEHAIITNVLVPKYGFPAWLVDPNIYTCTRALSLCAGLPGDLKSCAEVLKVSQKQDIGNSLINKYSKPAKEKDGTLYFREWADHDKQDMYDYCMADVKADFECYQILKNLPNVELEREAFLLDFKQNIQGIPIDIKGLEKVLTELDKRTAVAEKRMEEIGVNVRSPKQMIEKFAKYKVDNFQIKTVDKLLKIVTEPTLLELLELRQFLGKASTKKFQALKDMVSSNGQLRHFLYYYGAHTGRYSGQGFQPHNLPKTNTNELEINYLLRNIETINQKEFVIACKKVLPGLIKSPKDKTFLLGDFAAIEARGVAYLADQKDLSEDFKNGVDVYITMAATIFNKKESNITKKERALGKTVILGCGYGMGFKTFYATCNNWGIEIDEKLAEHSVRTYREKYRRIVGFWRDLEKIMVQALQSGIKYHLGHIVIEPNSKYAAIILPNGRRLYYHNLKYTRDGLEYYNYQQKRKVNLWGGILCENITQAMCRDILVDRMLECEKKKLHPILHVHDEIVCNNKIERTEQCTTAFKGIMNTPPNWLKGFPMLTEIEESNRYHK